MSSTSLHITQYCGYNLIARDMENPPNTTGAEESDGRSSAYSSQQLMPSDNDSIEESNVQRRDRQQNDEDVCIEHTITREEWFTVLVLFFVNLINYMDRFTVAGVLSNIQDEFKIGDDDGGLLQTIFILSYMVCAPLFGYLGDRYSRRWLMATGVLIWSTTTFIGSLMNSFGWFLFFRGLVGVGEASYSTIAPTIISDLFVHNTRSKMLTIFYFAIPVGSGFGYIVGSETARLAGSWQWALRVTPILGIAAMVLLLITKDPIRGESEGSHNLRPTTYAEDLKHLTTNRSFMLSTGGITCIAFATGALAWWGPKFMYLGLRMQPGNEYLTLNDVSYKFGIFAMLAGLIGVPLGSFFAQKMRPIIPKCDPYICAFGLLMSSPLIYLCLVLVQKNETLCYLFVFTAQISVNLCWSIVADILLYIVLPTRRSTAEAFQILVTHAFGDAGSPYLVGVMSEALKGRLKKSEQKLNVHISKNVSLNLETAAGLLSDMTNRRQVLQIKEVTNLVKFKALQYALFSTSFIEVVGGIFFLLTAIFILDDKHKAAQAVKESQPTISNRIAVGVDEVS